MKRREFITLIGSVAGAWPFAAHAQQPNSIRRIGLLMMYPEGDPQGKLRAGAFQREIEKIGWKVGGNLKINFHWGTGNADWVRSAVVQILSQAPDVMLANGDAAIKAAQQLARTVPVVFIASGDPVADGLVASLAHPGGNITGFAVMEPTLGGKLLDMLKQVAPQVTRVGVLVNPDSVTHQRIFALLTSAAPQFAVEVVQAGTGARARSSRSRDDKVGASVGLWFDRAGGSFDQCAAQAHHRTGGPSPHASSVCIARRRCRWRANVLRCGYSGAISAVGNLC